MTLMFKDTEVYSGDFLRYTCDLACIQTLACILQTSVFQSWYGDKHDYIIQLDSSFNDLTFSQGHKFVRKLGFVQSLCYKKV